MKIALLHDTLGADPRPDERDALDQARLVAEGLTKAGHETANVATGLDLARLSTRLRALSPDVVFNLVESLGGAARLLPAPAALLEELGVAFTGSGSAALFLTTHKVLAKRLLRAAGLPTPDWVEASGFEVPLTPGRSWILKPVWEDASVGIDDAAVIAESACTTASLLRPHAGTELFAEHYVEGRELNLSLLANGADGVEVLPPAEIRFEGFPPGKPRIVGYAAKWLEDSFESSHTPRSFEFPAADAPLLARLADLARRCFEVCGLRGYARVDFRVDAAGEPWILEVNANPCLSPGAGFMAAAGCAGLEAHQVVARIVAAARE
jgi:D-alanine-D-alanine ligase